MDEKVKNDPNENRASRASYVVLKASVCFFLLWNVFVAAQMFVAWVLGYQARDTVLFEISSEPHWGVAAMVVATIAVWVRSRSQREE